MDYVDVMIFRDILERHGLQGASKVERVLSKLLGSFTKEYSVNRWYNDWKSRGYKVGKDGLYEIVRHFEEAFILRSLSNAASSSRPPSSRRKTTSSAKLPPSPRPPRPWASTPPSSSRRTIRRPGSEVRRSKGPCHLPNIGQCEAPHRATTRGRGPGLGLWTSSRRISVVLPPSSTAAPMVDSPCRAISPG